MSFFYGDSTTKQRDFIQRLLRQRVATESVADFVAKYGQVPYEPFGSRFTNVDASRLITSLLASPRR